MNVTTQGIGHKVMSVLMALVLAIGLAPMVPAGNAWAMTSDAEFGQAAYEMTISPNAEGDYELRAHRHR